MLKDIRNASLTLIFLLGIWSVLVEPGLLIRREVQLSGWPLDKIKIVFISDLHAGAPHINKKYVTELVRKINGEVPDLVLIGGDLVINNVVGGKPIPFAEVAAIMKGIKARLGVFAVLGNHDWWNDAWDIRARLDAGGIRVLENDNVKINLGSKHFWLIGIGDDYTSHADLNRSLEGTGDGAPRISFMHDPGALAGNTQPFFAAIAGHMHGGQINLPFHGAIVTPGRAPREWASGLTRFNWGSLFVSKGIGTSSLPIRFNAIPEYVVFELKN